MRLWSITKRLGGGWMKWIFPATLLILVGGCLNVNGAAICDGTKRLRDAHADALLEDAGDRSVVTGAALIGAIDAGCSDV